MKKFLLLLFLMFSIFAIVARPVSAQEMQKQTSTDEQTASEGALPRESEAVQEETYVLPYPGLLPDNPLYPIKAFRDRMVSLLISDPLKKAEFNVLQSDKRMGASLALYKKGEKELAEQTVGKAGNYFEEAIAKASEAKQQGKDITLLLKQFDLAAQTYTSMLEEFHTKADGSVKKLFADDLTRMQELRKRIVALSVE